MPQCQAFCNEQNARHRGTRLSLSLTDKDMPKLLGILDLDRCPHCGIDRPHLTQSARFETNTHRGDRPRLWVAYSCQRCGGVVTGSSLKADQSHEVQDLYPSPRDVDEAIPDKAREYLTQALNSVNAPAGAVMLAASSIDAMLKAKGYTEGSLYSRIDKAAENHVVTSEMAAWAHEVRLDANDQRHADETADLPGVEDAERVIEFATALGQFMFVLPSRIRRGLEDAKGS